MHPLHIGVKAKGFPPGKSGSGNIKCAVLIDESFPNLIGLHTEAAVGIFFQRWIDIGHRQKLIQFWNTGNQ
jgi:hypothetical protein